MSKARERIVCKRPDGAWVNKRNDAEKASSAHQTQAATAASASGTLGNQGSGELTIKGVVPEDADVISRAEIFKSISAEAGGLYSQVVTVASTFLGGSLLFFEKVAPLSAGWIIVLWIALVALIAAIALTIEVRRMNLESGRLALKGKFEEASACDGRKDKLGRWSQISLIAGMLGLASVGLANIGNYKPQGADSMSKQSLPRYEEKSIPYGSVKAPAPSPQQGTGSGQPVTPAGGQNSPQK